MQNFSFSRGRAVLAGWCIGAAASLPIIAAPVLLMQLASPASAQTTGVSDVGQSEMITVRATVKAIDLKARTVTLVGPEGGTTTLKVGKDVQNLQQVQPGDVVVAEYTQSVAYLIAPPGTKVPADALGVAAVRAAPGEMPAGGVVSKVVVTGLVVGINLGAHTISLVDPDGGEVRTIVVKDPDNLRMLSSVKVGDTITAVISEAIAAVVEPAA
ncbi:MAG: hypothetical protein IPK66_07645 [Rhodospirillales bacterium]|nr:hypothetical protein [Rhodospirillales bacterium]